MNNNIRHIILDVDGVILGSKLEYDFPFPTNKVADIINKIKSKGVQISLCTGKPSFSVRILMDYFRLDAYHISDGGAVIFNPISNDFLLKKTVDNKIVEKILKIPLYINESWQVFTLQSKFIEAGKFDPKTIEDNRIMPYIEVSNLIEVIDSSEITKLELLYPPEVENILKEALSQFEDTITVQWTYIPFLLPNKILIITSKNVDKRSSVHKMLANINCPLKNVLSVGDTAMDWKFMEGSGYVATLDNAKDEVKELVKAHRGFIGGHVDNNGLVDVLTYYDKLLE